MKRFLLLIILLCAATGAQSQTAGVAYRFRGGNAAQRPTACNAGSPTDIWYSRDTDELDVCDAPSHWKILATASTAGPGNVVGPASAVDGHLAVFDLTTGKLIKDGGAVPVAAWGSITGTLSSQTDLQNALDLKAPLAAPVFTTSVASPIFKSTAADVADAGAIRLGNNEFIEWESNPTGTDLTLGVNASNNLVSSAPFVIGAGSAITSSGAGGALGTNAFTSTAYVPQTTTVAGFALSGNVTLASHAVGSGLSGSAYNGSGAVAWTVDQSFAPTWTGMHTFNNSTGTTFSANPIVISGSISGAGIFSTSGIRIKGTPGTLTDTTSSGTVATSYTDVLGGNTIAASSATTVTNWFSMYVNQPVAGSNVTLTNKWAIGADSLKIGTSNQLTVTTAGAVGIPGTLAVPIIGPSADSTTAFKITKADLSTAIVTVDSTNSRVGVGVTPTVTLDVNGTLQVANTIQSSGTNSTLILTGGGTNTGGGVSMTVKSAWNTSSGTRSFLALSSSYSQSGTAASTDFQINRTQTSAGSGAQLLADWQVGSASWYKFALGNTATTGGFNASSGVETAITFAPIINQSSTAGYTALLVNPTETATGSGIKLLADFQAGSVSKFSITNAGNATGAVFIATDFTNTTGGTTGAQTINKRNGSVNFAAAATSLVVTNSTVTTASIIQCTVGSNDTTLKSVQCVAASGSFTIFSNAAATAETRVYFTVLN